MYPGHPKILFVAYAHSSHTINWINLLQDEPFNIRVFGLPHHMLPPRDWPVPTYITYPGIIHDEAARLDPKNRLRLYPNPSRYLAKRVYDKAKNKVVHRMRGLPSAEKWLAEVIREWQPDIVNALGFDTAFLYLKARQINNGSQQEKLVLTIRGGPDIELQKANPRERARIVEFLQIADYLLGDRKSLDTANELIPERRQLIKQYVFPGAGGIDVDQLTNRWQNHPPSKRRLILWPKAHDSYYTSSLSTLEALRLCWDQIQPCELHILSAWEGTTVSQWFWTLPEAMQQAAQYQGNIPHKEVLDLALKARVMLAPSLLDGIPNTLLEAMACGAFPIVSPLESIQALVKEENVLFARNLYPQEIADAIIRAMNDDALVDAAAQRNIPVVRSFAHRPDVRMKAIQMYRDIVAEAGKERRREWL
jgi:glycosyltransferase involved in cell wall biosynthesis